MIGFWADPDFVAEIDRVRGHVSRSQFVRDALAEKLAREGVAVPRIKTVAPDRQGKGGRPRKHPPSENIGVSAVRDQK